jgi:hypothetical protein
MSRLEELLLLFQDQTIREAELTELKEQLASPAGRTQAAEDFFLTGVVVESLLAERSCKEQWDRPAEVVAAHAQGFEGAKMAYFPWVFRSGANNRCRFGPGMTRNR